MGAPYSLTDQPCTDTNPQESQNRWRRNRGTRNPLNDQIIECPRFVWVARVVIFGTRLIRVCGELKDDAPANVFEFELGPIRIAKNIDSVTGLVIRIIWIVWV